MASQTRMMFSMESEPVEVLALRLEFEALAHADQTTIDWERVEYTGIELVNVGLRGPTRDTATTVEVTPAVWLEFLDLVLRNVLPERAADLDVEANTQPELSVPAALQPPGDVGSHRPDAPTQPNRRASALTFLRCLVTVQFEDARRTQQIEGLAAMELYSAIYGFARETGLPLPA